MGMVRGQPATSLRVGRHWEYLCLERRTAHKGFFSNDLLNISRCYCVECAAVSWNTVRCTSLGRQSLGVPISTLTEKKTSCGGGDGADTVTVIQGAREASANSRHSVRTTDGFHMDRKQGDTESSDMRIFYESTSPDGRQ